MISLPLVISVACTQVQSNGREVVVTAERSRGSVDTDVEPITTLNERDIARIGARSLQDLVAYARRRALGSTSGEPILAIDGLRPISDEETLSLPPEAIARIDIFPQEVALKLGYPPTRPVMNFVTKPQFRGADAQGEIGSTSRGDAGRDSAQAGFTSIAGKHRLSSKAEYGEQSALLQSQRRQQTPGDDAFQTLIPSARSAGMTVTLAQPIGSRISTATTIAFDHKVTTSLEGRAATTSSDAGAVPTGSLLPASSFVPIRSTVREDGGKLAVGARGYLRGWQWLVSGELSHREYRTMSVPAVSGQRQRSASVLTQARGQVLMSGTLLALPAGPVALTAQTDADFAATSSNTKRGFRFGRSTARSSLAIEAPVTSKSRGFVSAIGDLTLNASIRATATDDERVYANGSYGLTWRFRPRLQFSMSMAGSTVMPEADLISRPLILRPNTPFLDARTGRDVIVTAITGGTADLRPATQRKLSASINLRPIAAADWSILLDYTSSINQNGVGTIPFATAAVERALPDRFVRNTAGELLQIDLRPINIARDLRSTLAVVTSYSRSLGSASEIQASDEASQREYPFLILDASFKYDLKHQLELNRNGDHLDLLQGGAVDFSSDQSRIHATINLGINYAASGVNMMYQWRSGTRIVDSGALDNISFSPVTRIDIQAFAALDRVLARTPLTRKMQVTLGVDNLLSSRPQGRSQGLALPLVLQPTFLDPLGRAVRVGVRKLF